MLISTHSFLSASCISRSLTLLLDSDERRWNDVLPFRSTLQNALIAKISKEQGLLSDGTALTLQALEVPLAHEPLQLLFHPILSYLEGTLPSLLTKPSRPALGLSLVISLLEGMMATSNNFRSLRGLFHPFNSLIEALPALVASEPA